MKRTTSNLALDAKRLLRHMGGIAALHRKLTLLGFEEVPTEVQMRRWVHRRSIPPGWLLLLLLHAKSQGKPIDLTDFIANAQ